MTHLHIVREPMTTISIKGEHSMKHSTHKSTAEGKALTLERKAARRRKYATVQGRVA